jgi:hypothetical protein
MTNDRTFLSACVGCRVRVRGTVGVATRPTLSLVNVLVRDLLLVLPGGERVTLDHTWVRRAHALAVYPPGTDVTFLALVEPYCRYGSKETTYGLTQPSSCATLPLPPSLRAVRRNGS